MFMYNLKLFTLLGNVLKLFTYLQFKLKKMRIKKDYVGYAPL